MTARAAPSKARTGRRNKGARRKARVTPATKRRSPSAADLQKQLQAHARELSEAHAQQAATAEVLRIIASSPGELAPVFNTILENGIRLCEASFGNLFLHDADAFRAVAMHGPASAYRAWYQREPVLRLADIPHTPLVRVARSKTILHIDDLRDEQAYRERDPRIVAMAESAGARTILGVPLLKDDSLIGAIFIYRREVRPFTDKQIALVKHFASQAVIAIENARLLNELRESLERQTATADVLRVISSSPGELKPLFDAMLENAVRICEAKFGVLFRYHAGTFHGTAWVGVPVAYEKSLRERGWFRPEAGAPLDRLCRLNSLSIMPMSRRTRPAQRRCTAVRGL